MSFLNQPSDCFSFVEYVLSTIKNVIHSRRFNCLEFPSDVVDVKVLKLGGFIGRFGNTWYKGEQFKIVERQFMQLVAFLFALKLPLPLVVVQV